MKIFKIFILVLLGIVSVRQEAAPVKIYPIVFCNTLDESIGKSCFSDKERFISEMSAIQAAIGCDDVDWSNIYEGEQCSKENLESVLEELSCTDNDVIFFYYSGHGARSTRTSDSEWMPQMCLKYQSYEEKKFASAKKVFESLKAKKPRLLIFLTDCCNDKKEWVSHKSLIDEAEEIEVERMDVKALKELFYNSKGTVAATSSKIGQQSAGLDRGGLFSLAFWSELYRIEQNQAGKEISWDNLLNATIQRTLRDSKNEQEPVKEVNIVNPHVDPPFVTPVNVIVTNNDSELKNALITLLDKKVSPLSREEKIPGILRKFFTDGATVTVMGRNGNVKFRPVLASDYLDELALSKFVKGVIIKESEKINGKYSNINLIEIR